MADSPIELPSQFAAAWNVHDGAAIGELFVDDARFVNVVGMFWRNRQEITAAHVYAHSTMFHATHLEILDCEQYPIGDGAVALHVRWRLTGQAAPDGSAEGPRQGILLLIAKRLPDGDWRIAVAQNTDVLEGALTRPGAPAAAEAS